ncbi:MAG TPA: PDZ domain-containing protein, partial [Planctomycetaceae bacterium]|nr:PDZ domain-containing protein [Planctomycetaceae bacterium]
MHAFSKGLFSKRLTLRVALVVTALATSAPAWGFGDGPLDAQEEAAFRQAVRALAPSLVRIQTVGGVDRVAGRLAATAATTGVVVSDDGWIVSSAFNFVSKPSSILVQSDKARYSARVVATDRLRMLTLLKVDAASLTPLRSDVRQPVRVGQWAIAVGRTYDSPEPSVSVGIVSALKRVWGKAIQTDAHVSPVNYGGLLIDLAGNALGLIVPLSPSGKEETAGVEWYDSGIGFAIPYADVLDSVERLKKGKDLYPGLLGVTVKEGGVEKQPTIEVVRFDSPAEKAAFKSGDIISEVDGQPVRRHDELKQALGHRYAGEKVHVVVLRGQEKVAADLVLVDKLLPYDPPLLGILPLRQAAGARGVGVRYVFLKSAAAKAGIAAGDQIRKWNETEITSADQLAGLVRRGRPGTTVKLGVLHDKAEKTVPVTLTADVEEIPHDLPALAAVGLKALAQDLVAKTAPKEPAAKEAPAPTKETPAREAAAKDPTEKNPVAADQTTKKSEGPKIGHFRDTLAGETKANYWAYVPESYSAKETWGLIVWIAPGRDSMEAALLHRWQNVCAERRLLIVAPLPDGPDFTATDLVGAWRVVENALKEYHIDPNRIVVHSYARGAPFASVLAFEHHEQFRGLALAASLLQVP